MSFAYKKISPTDVNINPYKANKKFSFENNNLSGSGITIYVGENISHDIINYFDAENDDRTSNNEYKRFIFDSIRQLFYKNYIDSGSLYTSTSFEEYPQTTLSSGSFTSNIRKINNNIGVSYQGNISVYNEQNVYDSESLYDNTIFDSEKGSLITIISVDKNIYGDNLKPGSFIITASGSYVRDDNEGNLFDYESESNYLNVIKTGIPPSKYIGNIFYSHGLIVITNQDYVCILGSPPTTVNDYYTYLNINQPSSFDILSNDYSDCGGIDFSSLELLPISGFSFPDCFIGGDSKLYITQNQNSFIPGVYKIGYTIKNNTGLQSNIGYVNLNIQQKPLEVNLNVQQICSGTIVNYVSYSFNINYGTPEYSYSFDNINYTPLSGFYNVSVSGTISSSFNTLYIKDYIGTTISKSFSPYYPSIEYTNIINKAPICNNTGSFILSSSQNLIYTLNNNPTIYNSNNLISLPTGSYIAHITSSNNCYTTNSFNIDKKPNLLYTLSTQSVSCYGLSNGSINISNIIGESSPYIVSISSSLGIITGSSITNIPSGTYYINILDNDGCVTEISTSIISPPELIISTTSSYSDKCMSSIIINGFGGVGPYTYKAVTPGNLYSSDNNSLLLLNDGLNHVFVTASVIDSNGCIATTHHEIHGRTYIYSGSYCEDNTQLKAFDDYLFKGFLPTQSINIQVLNNDSLGVLPTNIISINTSSLSSSLITASISPDSQSINLIMGSSISSSLYSFTYTIQDSTSATSSATIYFQNI